MSEWQKVFRSSHQWRAGDICEFKDFQGNFAVGELVVEDYLPGLEGHDAAIWGISLEGGSLVSPFEFDYWRRVGPNPRSAIRSPFDMTVPFIPGKNLLRAPEVMDVRREEAVSFTIGAIDSDLPIYSDT